jgi:acetyl-CoA acetyltransferase
VGDSERSRDFFAGAMDVGQATPRFEELTGLEFSPDGTSGRDRSVFMDYYARLARDHMARYGTTQRQLACVTAKNRGHAALNSNAQYQQPMTADEVLAAREIVWPLTLPMCAPIGNGAAAAVVCSADFLQGRSRARAVRIAALCLGSGAVRTHDDTAPALTRRLARQAYRLAGMSPSDVSLAEVHDASAIGEILQTEALGFVEDGEGGRAAEAGVTALGGRIPVNTSGGLECNGHPIGATGLAQVYEIVAQLRHEAGARQVEGARIGLTETAGGFVGDEDASACVGIFERLSA